MKIIQLFRDGKEIMASDGVMYVDGRFNNYNTRREVLARNKRFAKNFPHKVADSFAIYQDRIGSKLSNIHAL